MEARLAMAVGNWLVPARKEFAVVRCVAARVKDIVKKECKVKKRKGISSNILLRTKPEVVPNKDGG